MLIFSMDYPIDLLLCPSLSQVINPLPSLDDSCDKPIAKALFDFEDEQEQDLLSFKQVLWVGVIMGGLFPLWVRPINDDV